MCTIEDAKKIIRKQYLTSKDIAVLMNVGINKARRLKKQMISDTGEVIFSDRRYVATGPFVRWTRNEIYILIYERYLKEQIENEQLPMF